MNSDSENEEDDVEELVVLAAVVAVDEETELTLMASLPQAAGLVGSRSGYVSIRARGADVLRDR
jgi:hypothetical protein